jgi:splicing factor U2AF subunit
MQQTKHARRLYVGGITPDTSEDELGNFISDLITKSVDCAWDDNRNAVLQVYINREKCFAFVELKSIELTTASIAFDGIKFTNHNGLASTLRIRRPNDFKPELMPTQLRPIPTVNLSKIGVVCGNVSDGPEKVFVGGLPYQLSDDDVKELLSAFGPLKSFHLVRDTGSMTSKGYGFCEYLDSYTTNAAIAGLNGMTIGEKTLTVRLAAQTTPGFQTGSSQMLYQTPSQTSAFPQLLDVGSIRTSTDQYSQPGYTLSHLNLASTIPTRVKCNIHFYYYYSYLFIIDT